VPAAQRDEAQARFEVLGAEIAEAKVAVELAELSLGEATIRAPFDGTVIAELKQAGEQIQAGEGIARLADLASIEVDVAVPVDWALSRQADVPVRVDGPSGHAEAKLLSLVPTDAGTHQLRARLALPTGAAPIGARVRVAWPASEPVLAVTVPRDALIQRDEGYYVLRIDGDLARRIDVRPSTRVADRVAVIGAVGPGDEIVIRGGERLADGDKVAVLSGAVAAASVPCVAGRC
jgi:RND family efflux transporter MFP subunit